MNNHMTTNRQANTDSSASKCNFVPDRYRRHNFYDVERGVLMYGVDVRIRPGKWKHLAENGKPIIYDESEQRDIKLKQLRKLLRQTTTEHKCDKSSISNDS